MNTKFLVFDTQFLVFNTQFLVLNTTFIVFTHLCDEEGSGHRRVAEESNRLYHCHGVPGVIELVDVGVNAAVAPGPRATTRHRIPAPSGQKCLNAQFIPVITRKMWPTLATGDISATFSP